MEGHYPVVAHDEGGQIRKRDTRNFGLDRHVFHVTEVDMETGRKVREKPVELEELKVLFDINDFYGDPDDRPDGQARRHSFGDRGEVVFHDGETLIGPADNAREADAGLVLYPADHRTNNQIVAGVRSAVKTFRTDRSNPLQTLTPGNNKRLAAARLAGAPRRY